MHPPLHKPTNESACGEVIAQLEACHKTLGFWFGSCNDAKTAVVLCLRAERIARTTEHREAARERRKETEAKMKKLLE